MGLAASSEESSSPSSSPGGSLGAARVAQLPKEAEDGDRKDSFWSPEIWCSPEHPSGCHGCERSLWLDFNDAEKTDANAMYEMVVSAADLRSTPSLNKEANSDAQRAAHEGSSATDPNAKTSCAVIGQSSCEGEALQVVATTDIVESASTHGDSPLSASVKLGLDDRKIASLSRTHQAVVVSAGVVSVGVLTLASAGFLPVALAVGSMSMAMGLMGGFLSLRLMRWSPLEGSPR